MALKRRPIAPPPSTTLNITLQMAMPLTSSTNAPSNMAITEVSQVLPGTVPINISNAEADGLIPVASSPIVVAPAMASVPHKSAAIHTWSPDIWVG